MWLNMYFFDNSRMQTSPDPSVFFIKHKVDAGNKHFISSAESLTEQKDSQNTEKRLLVPVDNLEMIWMSFAIVGFDWKVAFEL